MTTHIDNTAKLPPSWKLLSKYQITTLTKLFNIVRGIEAIAIHEPTNELMVDCTTWHNTCYKVFIPTEERVTDQNLFPWASLYTVKSEITIIKTQQSE